LLNAYIGETGMADALWDRDFALEQAADDEELLAELIDLFHDSSASDLAAIKEGALSADTAAIGDAAHSIKGASASLGIEGIRSVAADIEKAGRAGDLEKAKSYLPMLEELLVQFKEN